MLLYRTKGTNLRKISLKNPRYFVRLTYLKLSGYYARLKI
jgi:hypothetical protein